MFLHVSVILSTGGGLPQCMLGYHPQGPGTPLGPGTHPEQTPHPGPGTPQTRHPPCDQASPGGRHPPSTLHAGRYGQEAGGMHPTGMQSCYSNVFTHVIHGDYKLNTLNENMNQKNKNTKLILLKINRWHTMHSGKIQYLSEKSVFEVEY